MPILVDTSVWVTHFRHGEPRLAELLNRAEVLGHPFVIGELALGHLRQRQQMLSLLLALPRTRVAGASEVLYFIDEHSLHGRGIGYVDAHLLAAASLSPGAKLWSHDRRLQEIAEEMKLAPESPI